MPMEVDLTGRRVLVTGGGQGVGRGLALGFADAGADVLVNDVRAERALDAVNVIRANGGRATPCVFDVTEYASVDSAIAIAGDVDVLVNNAGNAGVEGFGDRSKFADSDPADWEPFLRVNLYGVMNCTRAVLP